MSQQFHPLPLDVFNDAQRPYIERLNREMRDVFGLEGVLTNPLPANRSDKTIVRKIQPIVAVENIIPSIINVVNGSSSAIGVPSLTFSTGNAIGTTNTVVSINSTVKFPQAIMALGTALTLTLTDSATLGALVSGSSGFATSAISFLPPNGPTAMKIDSTAVRRSSSDFVATTFRYGFVFSDGRSTPHFWRLQGSTGGIPFFKDTGSTAP